MTEIAFLLNGTPVRVAGEAPTRTLLDWLREDARPDRHQGRLQRGRLRRLHRDGDGCATASQALNACILFLPQLHGKAVRTVEGIAGPGRRAAPGASRRWSRITAANAASARRASSCRWRWRI